MATTGTSGSRKVAWRRALRSRSRAGAMNGVWKAPPTATGVTLRAPSSHGQRRRRVDTRRGVAGDDQVLGRVVVGDPDVAVGPPAGDVDGLVVEAENRRHHARAVSSAAACMASPRSATMATPSSKASAPAATRAVYSPRLWPAHAVGSMPSRSTASRIDQARG